MRILLWQEDHPEIHGGAETWLLELAAGLRGLGHSVAWLKSGHIEQAVDQFKPDVALLGTIHNFIGMDAARRLAGLNIPGAWFLHDYWPFCGPRMLMRDRNRSDQGCEANAATCQNSCGGWHAMPKVMHHFRLVTGCEGAAAIMCRHGMDVSVIEEGIDTDLFRPAKGERDSPTTVYASAAGDEVWKGFRTLREAIGQTGWFDLRLLTGLTRADLAGVLGCASIYAFPSVYQEIWGLALTEAMACGAAVIASDVAGARAQVHEGLGVLVAPGDAMQLREALEWLATDHEARHEMGERAREHVEAEHSQDAHARRWEALFREMLKGER